MDALFPAVLSGLDAMGTVTWGSAFGSTPGYIPAAASRLVVFAVLPEANEMAKALERGLEKEMSPGVATRHARMRAPRRGFGIEEIPGSFRRSSFL